MEFIRFNSPFGPINAVIREDHLALLSLPGDSVKRIQAEAINLFGTTAWQQPGRFANEVERQIRLYFHGQLKKFDLPLMISGTDLQKKILTEVAKIPFGVTKSYGEIAKLVGQPRAARTVGTCMAKNRIPIVIPCHRVVAATGLGGFAGGLPLKKKLLQLEGALSESLKLI